MSKSRDILVLFASPHELRIASARHVDGRVELSNTAAFWAATKDGQAFALRDPSALEALSAFVDDRGWTGREVYCLLSGSSVACQRYDLPPLNAASLRQAAILKLGQQLHFDVAKAVVDVETCKAPRQPSFSTVWVNVTAVERDLVDAVFDAAKTCRLNVAAISSHPTAMAAMASSSRKGMSGLMAVFHVDERACTLVVLDGEVPMVITELPLGTADLTAALMRPIIAGENVIHLDESSATALRNEIGIPSPQQEIVSLQIIGERLLPLLEPVLQKTAKLVTQWLAFATTLTHGVSVKSMIVVGPGGAIRGLAAALAGRLNLEAATENWREHVLTGDDVAANEVDAYLFAVAAAQFGGELPDLVPQEIRRERKIERARRIVTWTGPIAAVMLLGLSFMFERMAATTASEISVTSTRLAELQTVITENSRWAGAQTECRRLAEQLNEFSRANPSWNGVFKELSRLLPDEMKAIEYNSRATESGMVLIVRAAVHSRGRRTFDEVISQAVLQLQRSPFFNRVEVTANRGRNEESPQADGVVSLELSIVYPRPRTESKP